MYYILIKKEILRLILTNLMQMQFYAVIYSYSDITLKQRIQYFESY